MNESGMSEARPEDCWGWQLIPGFFKLLSLVLMTNQQSSAKAAPESRGQTMGQNSGPSLVPQNSLVLPGQEINAQASCVLNH